MRRADRALSPRSAVALAILGSSIALASTARAEEPCTDRVEPTHTVDLTLWSARPDARWVAEVIDELLARLDVHVCRTAPRRVSARELSEPPADPTPALGRVVLSRAPRWITVYVIDSAWERVLLRQVETGDAGLDEVAREQIAHIVLGTVEALLAGERIGVPRTEIARQADPIAAPRPQAAPIAPPRDVAPVPPVAPSERDDGLGLALGYTARLQGTDSPVAHEASLGLVVPFARGVAPFVGVRLAYRFASRVASQDVGVDVSAMGGRIIGGVRVPLDASALFYAGAAAGAERARAVSSDAAPDIAPAGPVARWFPRIAVELGLERALSSGIALAVSLEAQLDVVDERYVVREREGVTVIADPWRIRPAGTLSLVWHP